MQVWRSNFSCLGLRRSRSASRSTLDEFGPRPALEILPNFGFVRRSLSSGRFPRRSQVPTKLQQNMSALTQTCNKERIHGSTVGDGTDQASPCICFSDLGEHNIKQGCWVRLSLWSKCLWTSADASVYHGSHAHHSGNRQAPVHYLASIIVHMLTCQHLAFGRTGLETQMRDCARATWQYQSTIHICLNDVATIKHSWLAILLVLFHIPVVCQSLALITVSENCCKSTRSGVPDYGRSPYFKMLAVGLTF